MTRITKDLTAAIVQNALEKAGINKRRAEWREAFQALLEAARVEHCGGPEKLAEAEAIYAEHLALVKRVPDGFLWSASNPVNSDSYANVSFGGMACRANYLDENGDSQLRIRPRNRLHLPADHPLTAEFERLHALTKTIDDNAETIEENVRGALSKFTTIKRLLEAWPEAAELLPEQQAKKANTLPAVPVDTLNALIGLPTESAEA